ncbi:MAG: response regulator [Geobacter sp.]|nr:response regulator [Geobacter sp.]
MKVLIVDDNAKDRKLLRLCLEKRGCQVLEAADGEAGLEMAGSGGPELIISDAMMPKLDGFNFLRKIKRAPQLQTIPFVFYSAVYCGSKDEELGLALGADAFLIKPTEPEELWQKLSEVVERNGRNVCQLPSGLPAEEEEYLKRYTDIVTSKLEEKVAELEKARQELERSEQRYSRLLGSVTDYIYTVQVKNGRPVSTSHGPGCLAVTGYTPEEYSDDPGLWYRMVSEADREAVERQTALVLSGEDFTPVEHRIIHKDGRIRWIRNTPVPRYDAKGKLTAYDGLVSDITDLKKLEEKLRHAQKMEAVGQLAGGIAHDFNNILTAVIGYGSLLEMHMKGDDPLRHNVEQILAAAERAATLTQGLLVFGRKQILNPKPVNLNDIVRSVEKLLARLITEDIEMKSRLAGTDLVIMADAGQIDQVLINLVTNARDAMPDGGVLTIETEPAKMDHEFIKTHGYGIPGNFALLSVTDTGVGLDEQTRLRVFEPFFTTKEVGKGTGLGLSIVYGIVKQHNGYISVYSEQGKGTAFKIYLPQIRASVLEAEAVAPLPARDGHRTILVADDDTEVRNITRALLEEYGYEVVEAADGDEAVAMFNKHRDRIDLLLLDVVMPRKNGKEAYDEIIKLNPDIKALFFSGYTADVIKRKGVEEEGLNLLTKPVAPRQLLNKVREILKKGARK